MKQVYILQDKLRGGGTERQSIELTDALLKANIPVQLIVLQRGGALDSLAEMRLSSNCHFSSGSVLMGTLKHFLKFSISPPAQPHLMVCMGRWAHCLTARTPKPIQQKRISTLRTSRPLSRPYRSSIRNSDYMLTNSHWALEQARNQLGSSNLPPHTVIHNALSRPELLKIDSELRAAARSHFGLGPNDRVLLNVARLDPGKGQGDLIETLTLINQPNIQLWLLGTGPERKRLETSVERRGLQKQVRFFGFCRDPMDHFAAADIFVSASQLDSLPNALIEAHAAALPILAYPSQGIPEVIDDAVTGALCQPATPVGMAETLQTWLKTPERYLEMGQAGRQKVLRCFDRTQQNMRFIQIIQQLLTDRSNPIT